MVEAKVGACISWYKFNTGFAVAKKNNAVIAEILKRLENERWERRLSEKNKRVVRRGMGRAIELNAGRVGKNRPLRVRIPVPAVLDFVKDHQGICEFVKQVTMEVRDRRLVVLDFDETKKISASALIYLLASIHKLHLQHGKKFLTGTYPASAGVERLLTQSGFFKLLNIKGRGPATVQNAAMRYIRFKSELSLKPDEIVHLKKEILREDLSMPLGVAKTLFRAISEAMTNVNHHAYEAKQYKSNAHSAQLKGRWWLFASLNVKSNLFTLAFYDSGVGIPRTLPRKYGIERILSALSLIPGIYPNDAEMIKAAMVLGRTRTGLQNRGKGLIDLARLIDILSGGQMRIYSRHGVYVYSADKADRVVNGPGFLEGTLIEWQLPLDKAVGNLPKELLDETVDDA